MIRILLTIVAVAVACYCAFGFLASFEPGVNACWKIGYGVAFIASVIGALIPWTATNHILNKRR